MASFVVDASVTLSWCFEDEANAAADALLERLRCGGLGILSPSSLRPPQQSLSSKKGGAEAQGGFFQNFYLAPQTDSLALFFAWRQGGARL